MEDKPNESPAENANTSLTNAAEETIAAGETSPTEETHSMEVHHPHIHHTQKKWKEYFFEFVMIFLAVTLGFIAENLREHISERVKEKQYISGFIHDIKDDTAALRHVIEQDRRQVQGIDSMLKLAHANMSVDSNRRRFYYFATHYLYNSSLFKSNDATLQQLKSTGDYRLIEKDHVTDSLTRYDAAIQSIYIQGEFYEIYFREILSRLDDLIDITVLGDTSFIKNGEMMNIKFPAVRDDNEKLITFFNKLFVFRIITNSYTENYLKPQLENTQRLIVFLKNEYDMKE